MSLVISAPAKIIEFRDSSVTKNYSRFKKNALARAAGAE